MPLSNTVEAAERILNHLPGVPERGSCPGLPLQALSGDAHRARILQAVERVCASRTFQTARRAQALLRYLVHEVLGGRGEAIKEFSIAQDVFGRDASFDPKIDACVRTEAWRLRQRLKTYYETEVGDDPIQVCFAPRSLAPSFHGLTQDAERSEAATNRLWINFSCDPGRGGSEREMRARLAQEVALGLRPIPRVAPHIAAVDPAQMDWVLTCDVREGAGETRVVFTLTERATGDVLAIEAYAREVPLVTLDVDEMVDAVAAMVSDALSGHRKDFVVNLLDDADRKRFLDFVLRGDPSDRSDRLAELRANISHQERIIRQDPTNKLAYRRVVSALGLFLATSPPTAVHLMPKLLHYARAILAKDAGLDDVWLTLALCANYTYDWELAREALQRAIAINPIDPSAYILSALSSLSRGELDQALEAAETATLLDPASPLVASSYGLVLCASRRFADAICVGKNALQIDPNFARLHLIVGEAYMHAGDLDSAVLEFDTAHRSMPGDSTAKGLLGLAYARSGNREQATSLLADVEQISDTRMHSPTASAMIHIGLGDYEDAIGSLQRAVQRRGTPDLFIATASFDAIRSDRRFNEVRSAMGFVG